jgi:hypothetical protein
MPTPVVKKSAPHMPTTAILPFPINNQHAGDRSNQKDGAYSCCSEKAANYYCHSRADLGAGTHSRCVVLFLSRGVATAPTFYQRVATPAPPSMVR